MNGYQNVVLPSEEEQKKTRELEEEWMSKHNFDQWYNILQTDTFSSMLIEITEAEGIALSHLYKQNKLKSSQDIDEKEKENNSNVIEQLKQKITSKLTDQYSNISSKNGYFIRLSCRSPKDAVMDEPY